MNIRNRALPLFLVMLLMLSGCNASSGVTDDTVSAGETVPETETEFSRPDLLPDQDFGGYGFHILTYNNAYMEHRAEELNGEPLNDAVFARNSYVEERYNIDITVTDMDHEKYVSTIQQNVQSGEDAVDVYQIFLSHAASNFVTAGYFLDWNEIPYVSENLHQPWWCQYGLEQLQIRGKNYLLNGDFGFMTLSYAQALLFNQNLFTDLGIAYPYNDVLDGSWTLDKLLAITDGQDQDLNGDGALTADEDRFGFMTTVHIAPIALAVGCDLETIRYDETGYPQLNLMTEKMLDVYDKMYRLICSSGLELDSFHIVTLDTIPYKAFWEDRALITAVTIGIMTDLRDMESAFGVLPMPKYNEEQESYMSSVDAGTMSASVAITAADTERTGLIVEALCEKGSELVIPAYYNTILQDKASRDTESHAMLDIIRESSCFDPLYVYNFNGMGFFFNDTIHLKIQDVVSTYEAREAATLTAIQTFWDSIQE